MIKKSFVSVCFLPGRLLILQLNSSKKKIKRFASFDLPKELVDNYKVQNIKALSELLKAVWKKMKLKEKSVGIVIPEFSTFMKLLDLPKLAISELDEAIRWQAQEFLPATLDKMIMDWKIVGRKNDGYEVLLVAIGKEVLIGFVKAAEGAGLFPLAVETPSLCLARVVSTDSLGKLIIHVSYGETVLAVAEDGKIRGTSVIRSDSPSGITRTAQKITSHYKNVKVEKVLVGGVGVDDKLVSELESGFGKKVESIKINISGLSDEASREYLIPICMQLNELEEPSDPGSLNLLPSELVEKYKKAKSGLQIWSLTLTITLFVWISFLTTLVVYLFLTQQIGSFEEQNLQEAEVVQQRKSAVSEVGAINTAASKVIKIEKASVLPQTVLNEVTLAGVDGVDLSEYNLNLDKGTIDLKGIASNRLTLLDFKNNLGKNENFVSIAMPISSFETEKDIQFELTCNYLPITKDLSSKKK